MENDEKNKSGYTVVLLLAYLFGALMSLIYIAPLNSIIHLRDEMLLLLPVAGLLINALLVSSVNGLIIQPFTSVVFGVCTALWVYRMRFGYSSVKPPATDAIVLSILIPLHFVICSIGMRLSSCIRAKLSINKEFFHKTLFTSYTVMFVAVAMILFFARYIMII